MTAEGVLASPIHDYGAWLEQPQTQATDAAPVFPVADPGEGPVVRTPGRTSYTTLSPALGQHSRALLGEAGINESQIDNLIAKGAVIVSA